MAQHDYVIANQGFPAFRSDLNDALAAIVSNNSGATEPTTMFAHQLWVDTAADPSILKIRNADNDAWITIGTINQTGDTFTLTSAVSATTLNTSGAVVFNDAGADVDFRVEGDTDANLLFVDAGNDRVGVGIDSPQEKVTISTTGTSQDVVLQLLGTNSAGSQSSGVKLKAIGGSTTSGIGVLAIETRRSTLAYEEAIRVDSSGNLLVGKTAQDASVAGFQVRGDIAGLVEITRASGNCVTFRRNTTDGDIAVFRKDGTTVGSIGTVSGYVYLYGTASTGTGLAIGANTVYPCTSTGTVNDNTTDLGIASTARFNDAYITNGVTTGSDRNDKQDIEELTEAETRVAVAAKALLRKWRWKDAVAKKGDDARIHFGIIAQDLKAAFEAEGLDAHRYAMFMWNEWWEKERIIPAVEGKEAVYETQTDEEGNETQVLVSEAVEAQPERTVIDTFETEEEAGEGAVRKERMGIRYNELLAFIIAAI